MDSVQAKCVAEDLMKLISGVNGAHGWHGAIWIHAFEFDFFVVDVLSACLTPFHGLIIAYGDPSRVPPFPIFKTGIISVILAPNCARPK